MGSPIEKINGVIDQVFFFRKKFPDYAKHEVYFVPENNQGALPIDLRDQLKAYSPKLCNWYIYSTKKLVDETTSLGYHTGDDEKFVGACLLKNDLKTKCVKFSKLMDHSIINKVLEEFKNEHQKTDLLGKKRKSAIPEIYPKHGHHDDALMCLIIGRRACLMFLGNDTINRHTLNNVYVKCPNCPLADSGHRELIEKKRFNEF